MSYRTTVNGVQIFGNNETYPEWDEFIRSQGMSIGDEGEYDGEITDFYGAVTTIEKIVRGLMDERKADWEKEKYRIEQVLKNDPGNHWATDRKANLTRSYFDFSGFEKYLYGDGTYREAHLDILFQIVQESYAFYPYTFYLACRDQLDLKDPLKETITEPGGCIRIRNYVFKPGMSAHVHAG